MHVVVWGAGGIGCYYGARLQQAGNHVSFVCRGEHLKVMQRDGLQLHHDQFKFNDSVEALSEEELMQRYSCDKIDLIIVCLKNTATDGFINKSREWLKGNDTPLLSLQNGVDNEPSIAQCTGRSRVLGGLAVRIGGHILSPGIVEAKGVAQVVFGAWPNSSENAALAPFIEQLKKVFADASIDASSTDNIQYELWRKLLINNGVNPLSALTGMDTRTLTSHPSFGKSVYQMMLETAEAAQADNVILTRKDVDEMYQLICQFDAIKTSMLVDKEKGRPLELDGICGAVTSRLKQQGKEAPVTQLVAALLDA